MAFDAHVNFAFSLVAVAPSPAVSGVSLTVGSGDGIKFPTAPFNAVICPVGTFPLAATAEIVRVTIKAGDVFTITRAVENSFPRAVLVGDQIFAGPTAKSHRDIENAVNQATALAIAL